MTKTYDQTTGELCEKCGWSMKFPGEPCRCELERENAILRRALADAISTFQHEDEAIVTAERVEAWRAALSNGGQA